MLEKLGEKKCKCSEVRDSRIKARVLHQEIESKGGVIVRSRTQQGETVMWLSDRRYLLIRGLQIPSQRGSSSPAGQSRTLHGEKFL
ncbi:hypothetical protein EYC80_001015 [Monilinia laxa]|uniref:Uncharacterized protein n=1 Tax=Monilinia laxa TaxID=61186 RepID=A0A5N6K812_MONLA|nr:hypothetical protein EYC80_001015 [Monilinia laxa]